MKKLIIIVALFINSFVNTQTNFDSILLVRENEYRTSLGLTKVQFDKFCYKTQTKLDSIVLVKVNEYRTSLDGDDENGCLTKVQFDKVCYKAADNQSSYLLKKNIVGHDQNNIEFKTLLKRYIYFGGNKRSSIAEVCNSVNKNLEVDNDMYLDSLAKLIVSTWKDSDEHDKILKCPKYKFIGVSTKLKILNTGNKNWIYYDIVSTMVFTTMK